MQIKPLLSLLAILFSALITTAAAQEVNVKKYTANERKFNRLMKRDKVILIDVRSAKEFAASHIPGAINIDVKQDGFEQKVKALGPYKTYLIYCRSGQRSEEALIKLYANGDVKRVYHLDGGINAWATADMPIKSSSESLASAKQAEEDTL